MVFDVNKLGVVSDNIVETAFKVVYNTNMKERLFKGRYFSSEEVNIIQN